VDEDFVLRQGLLQLAPEIYPPRAIEFFRHHFEDEDVVVCVRLAAGRGG
jgi:hypothetical protein